MSSAPQPTADLAATLRQPTRSWRPIGAAADRSRLPGRRRRPRPPARPRPGRHRRRRRGRRRRAGRAARRRAGRARALRHRQGRLDGHEVDIASARTETYPQPGRAAGGARRPPSIEADLGRRDFTINAMAIPLRRRAAADRPARRPGATSRPACCGSCTRAPSSTTRPGRSAPPATPPASASSWSRRRRSCCAQPTSTPSRPTAARRSCCASPPNRRRRAGFALLPSGGCSSCATGGVELAARGRRLLADAALARAWRRATGRCSPPRSGRPAAR